MQSCHMSWRDFLFIYGYCPLAILIFFLLAMSCFPSLFPLTTTLFSGHVQAFFIPISSADFPRDVTSEIPFGFSMWTCTDVLRNLIGFNCLQKSIARPYHEKFASAFRFIFKHSRVVGGDAHLERLRGLEAPPFLLA